MVCDLGTPIAFVASALEAYGHCIDIAKLTAWHVRQPEHVVRRKVDLYRRFDVEPQSGGPILEIARAQHREDAVLEYLWEAGFRALEVSAESLPTQFADDEEVAFMGKCKALGFRILGEVGKKFFDGDNTRRTPHEIDIDQTVRRFNLYLENGAEHVYWEGHLIRAVLGDMGERESGRDDVISVAEAVGLHNIIFEIPATYLPYAGKRALQALLVHMFGPDVNIANALIDEVPELEEIRGGTFPAFGAPAGDHPWMASLQTEESGREGAPNEHGWWRGTTSEGHSVPQTTV